MNKNRLLLHYKENVRWSILLHIKFIRENKFPYQLKYWKSQLKKDLEIRRQIFEKLKLL